jgi:hypothetical protein
MINIHTNTLPCVVRLEIQQPDFSDKNRDIELIGCLLKTAGPLSG